MASFSFKREHVQERFKRGHQQSMLRSRLRQFRKEVLADSFKREEVKEKPLYLFGQTDVQNGRSSAQVSKEA